MTLPLAAEAPQNPLIPTWPELIIGALAFLIVFALLAKVLMPRISTTSRSVPGGVATENRVVGQSIDALERRDPDLAWAFLRHTGLHL